MKILEKVRRAKGKSKPKKPEFSPDALRKRDEYGLRARDYLYVIVGSTLAFFIVYLLLKWNAMNSLLFTLLVAIILFLLLMKLVAEKKIKEKKAYYITWIDPEGIQNVPIYHNLKVQFCNARILPDGTPETIPQSVYLNYYEERYMQRKFNPALREDWDFLSELEAEGKPVIFADGTDGRFDNPLKAMKHRIGVKESKGLTEKAKQKTAQWIATRKSA